MILRIETYLKIIPESASLLLLNVESTVMASAHDLTSAQCSIAEAQDCATAYELCASGEFSHIILDVQRVDQYGPKAILALRQVATGAIRPNIVALGAGSFPEFTSQLRGAGADTVVASKYAEERAAS